MMMAEHKRNHRIPLANIINPRIENGGFWGGNVNRLVFNDASAKNKKLMYTFDESEDIASALQYLNAILPNLQVSIEYNAAKNKYVKAK